MISFEKSVGAVIFCKEDNEIKYLLLRYRGKHWDFPKGHGEKGEIDEEALRREVREETGINDLKIIDGFSKKVRFFYIAKGDEAKERKETGEGIFIFKKVKFYLVQTFTQEVKLSFEHIGSEWLGYDEALEKITYKKSQKVLKAANSFLAQIQ